MSETTKMRTITKLQTWNVTTAKIDDRRLTSIFNSSTFQRKSKKSLNFQSYSKYQWNIFLLLSDKRTGNYLHWRIFRDILIIFPQKLRFLCFTLST